MSLDEEETTPSVETFRADGGSADLRHNARFCANVSSYQYLTKMMLRWVAPLWLPSTPDFSPIAGLIGGGSGDGARTQRRPL